MSEALLGDAVFANIILLGLAWQNGLAPVYPASLTRAIALDGVAITQNQCAFALGRIAAANPDVLVENPAQIEEMPQELLRKCSANLTDYQNQRYAMRYREGIKRVDGQ